MNPFTFIAKALSDGENPSTMRVLMLAGAGSIIGVWTLVSFRTGTVQEFPQSVIEVLGALIIGKVAEKHIESKTP